MPSEEIVAVHAIVEGRVQGVGYRMWCERAAAGRGLSGWVRNRRNGEVEALFSGRREAVEAMLEACRSGPPGATVTRLVRADASSVTGVFRVLDTV